VLDPALHPGNRLRHDVGEREDHDHQRPEFLEEEVLGVRLEQLPHPEDRDQELADDDALDAADDSQAKAGENFGQRGGEQDLPVERATPGPEAGRHLEEGAADLPDAHLGVEHDHEHGEQEHRHDDRGLPDPHDRHQQRHQRRDRRAHEDVDPDPEDPAHRLRAGHQDPHRDADGDRQAHAERERPQRDPGGARELGRGDHGEPAGRDAAQRREDRQDPRAPHRLPDEAPHAERRRRQEGGPARVGLGRLTPHTA
jgi:hypothetical protein